MASADLTLLIQIATGGMLGMLGQGLRAVAGMKKINDAAIAQGRSFGDLFSASQFGLSLFIGFTAGALALVLARMNVPNMQNDASSITSIVAAGYAGTDFIEAFLSKMPGGDSASKASMIQPPPMG